MNSLKHMRKLIRSFSRTSQVRIKLVRTFHEEVFIGNGNKYCKLQRYAFLLADFVDFKYYN